MKKHKNRLTCRHPDRDFPKLMCAYPIPCPYHTVEINLTSKPAKLIIPITATIALAHRQRLADIAEILAKESEGKEGVG